LIATFNGLDAATIYNLAVPDSKHIVSHKTVEGFCGLGIKTNVAALLSSLFTSGKNLAIVLGLHLEYSMADFL
jgi:hypothetical protein